MSDLMSDLQQNRQGVRVTILLIIDEFGYLPHDREAGPLFYQVIIDRYERKGTIITSNKSLRFWAEVLHDPSLAAYEAFFWSHKPDCIVRNWDRICHLPEFYSLGLHCS